MKDQKFQFPLEDDYSSRVTFDESSGFNYLHGGYNGIYIKAPFDCKVKKIELIEGQDGLLPTWGAWAFGSLGAQTYQSFKVVYESLDGKTLFSASGMLPNDKSKNVGKTFKKGENIGRVLNKDSGFAYKYYDLAVVDGVLTAETKDPSTVVESIEGIDPEKLPKSTLDKVILFAEITAAILAASYVYKAFKGK